MILGPAILWDFYWFVMVRYLQASFSDKFHNSGFSNCAFIRFVEDINQKNFKGIIGLFYQTGNYPEGTTLSFPFTFIGKAYFIDSGTIRNPPILGFSIRSFSN